jgi:hypothetical protein
MIKSSPESVVKMYPFPIGNNLYWFDKFIENIESEGPHQLQIVEDHLNLDLEENEQQIIDEAESTLDIFKKYISS